MSYAHFSDDCHNHHDLVRDYGCPTPIPTIVALCGSTRFRDEFAEQNRRLTLDGAIVLAPGVFGGAGDAWTDEQKIRLDELHKRKIELAHQVYIVNPGGYVGESTRAEIEYATKLGKPIAYLVDAGGGPRLMLTIYDEFSGCGGTLQGATKVPHVKPILAANHNELALRSHAANFPDVDHCPHDVQEMPITHFPRADLFLASPACPPWTDARGKKRDFDMSNQQTLFGDGPDEETTRNRLLMEEIPRYLRHWVEQGKPVLGGMVENVIQCRRWDQWGRWIREIEALGYQVRVIALNSMHAHYARHSLQAPQSRCRLYVGYVHNSVGRIPDWDKWLRPRAYCPVCDQVVTALQVFKRPGNDMGRYRQQYVYRCPHASCRNHIVEPEALPAYVAIDWALKGIRIGDRDRRGLKPLEPATIARLQVGMARYWAPLLSPTGGTWRTEATSVFDPMPTRTTRENDAVAVPPLFVPVEGRPGKVATSGAAPMRTQTARNETGLAFPPFLVPMRGGGDKENARPISEPMGTVTSGGNHHYLAEPPSQSAQLLVPYYSNGTARPVSEPIGTLSTRDRFGLAEGAAGLDVDDVLFRMLEPHEIGRGMAFGDDYIVLGSSKRARVRQYGNAVTPPVAEVIVSALVEAITGEALELAS